MIRQAKNAARRLAGTRVLVFGDVMLDEYVTGHAGRISPEAPVAVLEEQQRSYVPGGAANTAANVASLGGSAMVVGLVGDDAAAAHLRDALVEAGVDFSGLVADPARPTTTKTRIVAGQHQLVRVDREARDQAVGALESGLLSAVEARLPQARACVVSDYAKGTVTRRLARRVIAAAVEQGVPVVVDPKTNDFRKYHGATVITPNALELARALGLESVGDGGVLAAGRKLQRSLGHTSILVTLGARGVALFAPGEEPYEVPSRARSVFDVTGAGDTVVAALALALGAGRPMPVAVELANLAAGVAVSKPGTARVTLAELLAAKDPSAPTPKSK